MIARSEEIKRVVLDRISGEGGSCPSGHATYRVADHLLHVRFCSADRLGSHRYKFNINPNTLRADYEVWICGDADVYYLVPMTAISRIYHDPEAYIDNRHPEIRVVSLSAYTNVVTYATGGKSIALTPYLRGTLQL